jgi:hypothetical protein
MFQQPAPPEMQLATAQNLVLQQSPFPPRQPKDGGDVDRI